MFYIFNVVIKQTVIYGNNSLLIRHNILNITFNKCSTNKSLSH